MEIPERITDLTLAQRGATFELTFTRPLDAADGERLTKPLQVELFRAITKSGAKPPETFMGAASWLTLSSDDLLLHTQSDKIVYPARLPDAEYVKSLGATFTFAVRGLTHGFRNRPLESKLSNVVRARLLDVSGPIENFRIKTTEKALELSWSPPSRSLSGQPISTLSGYRVYLSPSGKPASFELRGENSSPQFSDSRFAFDHTYFYKVRAVFKQGDQVAESKDSTVAEITPRDTFPPATPTNVTALFASGAVELVWTANTEPDLAGYNVYRHEKDSPWQRVNAELLRTPTFEDRTVQSEHQYFYRVTAVDLTHNESSPSEEVELETR